MSETQQVVVNSNGIVMTLFIIFLILKLTNVIDWSWWWVTSPLWISASFIIMVLTLLAIIAVIEAILSK